MKKTLLTTAIAAALTVPFAAQAAKHMGSEGPSIKFSGDAEYNYYQTDTGADGAGATGLSKDNRVRLKVDAKVNENVSAHTRFRAKDINGATNADYAYITAKMGSVSVSVGDQLATWGHKIHIDSAPKTERIKVSTKAGPVTLMVTQDASSLPDNAAYTFYVLGAAGPGKFGAFYADETTPVYDIFYMGEAGGVKFGIEHFNQDKDGADNAAFTFLHAGMDMGKFGAGFSYLTTKGGRVADSDFSPLHVFNTTLGAVGSSGDVTWMALNANAGLSGGYNLSATLANVEVAKDAGSELGIDLTASKSLGKNANVDMFYSSLKVGNNTASVLGFEATVKF